ncbi:MAG: insulinase family protein [Deltaproteobacteria bacterium]|nr:insulinase family protein [Deltaproteobacteria bacterium]
MMRTRVRLARTCLMAMLLWSGRAWAAPLLPKLETRAWTLENGLDVAFVRLQRVPVVTVQVWYHVGSKDEDPSRRGSAHMFEHLMFKGTTRVPPEEHARLVERIGGDSNAFTSEDLTAYYNTVPRQYLDFAIMLEAERMRNLVFRKEVIDAEREVVKEEYRMTFENDPVSAAFLRLRELAFTRHPYRWTAIGDPGDLDATTLDDLKRFYDTYYQPGNATLIVVGDVSEDEVRASAEKWLAPIPNGPRPPRPASSLPEPQQEQLRREIATRSAQVGVVIGGYKVPPAGSDDTHVLRVITSILSDGESSRLHQRLVRKDRIGVQAGAFIEPQEDPTVLIVYGAHLAQEQRDKVEAALMDEVGRLARERVSERELAKAKNQLAADLVVGLQNVEGIATQVGLSKVIKGNPLEWLDAYDKYLAVTSEDIQRVARSYLLPSRLTVVLVPPSAGGMR